MIYVEPVDEFKDFNFLLFFPIQVKRIVYYKLLLFSA